LPAFFDTEDHLNLSRKLLYMAFAIEIGVAVLAIYLGMMSVQTGSSGVEMNILNKTLSPILFTVVAIIELTRVPIFISIYRSESIRWKIFGSIFLITIMYIAFETLLTAFTMNGAMQTGKIDKSIIEKRSLSEKREILLDEIQELSTLTQDKINFEYDNALKIINEEESNEIGNINDSIEDIELMIAQSSISSITGKEQNINGQLAKIEDIKVNEIENIKLSFKNKEDLIRNQILKFEQKNDLLNDRIAENKYPLFGNYRSQDSKEVKSNEESIEKLNQELIKNEDSLKVEINSINSKYLANQNKLNLELNELADKKIQNELNVKNEFSNDLKMLRDNKSLIYNKFSERKKDVLEKKEIKEKKLESAENILENKKNEKINIERKISDIRDNINKLTRTNVNYIVATSVGPNLPFLPACKGVEESSDVSRTCYRNVTFLFWGSISVVVAITGTVVAMASEVLRSSTIKKMEQPKGRRPLRRIFTGIYKYYKKPKTIIKEVEKIIEKPVEIVKEVPVQKVEFTEVPKIQEVIKKEIVHVPLYTNDESLIDIHKDRKKKNKTDEPN